MASPTTLARIQGVLLGQAVGDALGTRYEFSTVEEAAARIATDIDSYGHLPILGEGPFQLIPGQITDDTELAMLLARRVPGVSEVGLMYVAKAFVDWFKSHPFDIGMATRNAFGQINPDQPIEAIHSQMMDNALRNMNSLSNGCLMKISPVAIMGALRDGYSLDELANFAGGVCQLTNPNPIAVDATRVYVFAIRKAVEGLGRRQIWEQSLAYAQTDLVRRILTAANERPSPAPAENRDDIYVDGSSQGYLGVALQLAFYELLHGTTFERSLVDTVKRGGDTDTNGCIVGALLGAFYGYQAIPADWRSCVLAVNNPRTESLPEVATNDLMELAETLGNF